ncbi:caspase family protein [Reichenbachiella agariperforans]|uniref:caspase family protein n=1 Tax=Reichenbachiella agariperforans TaxID=156994 RepID=UPI001C09EB5C|nr:caspase family protein [Reichenbachiella agariperforans]MBU2914387.1 caspase family protein [Reichenbachiella agariperforans]
MKKLLLLITITLTAITAGYSQTVSAKSGTVSLNYVTNSPTYLELRSPEYLAEYDKSRGFIQKVEVEYITIEGVIADDDGVKGLWLNNYEVDISERTGSFSYDLPLQVGDNTLTFEAIDEKGNTFSRSYQVEREKPIPVEVEEPGKYYALIIGIQDYDDPSITDLDNPIKDAKALYKMLTEQYTFDVEYATLLENPTRDQIYDKLDGLSAQVTTKDNLLIFYAGHGYWDEQAQNGYWLPRDAEEDKKRDWMRNSAVTEYVREINSKHTLLITDACFGGSIFKTRKAFKDASMGINKLYELPSRKAMTSGTLTEVPDKSVFMKYLLKNLERNEEKYVASEQLFYQLKPAVLNNSPNTPQFGEIRNTGDEGGDFIFKRRIIETY